MPVNAGPRHGQAVHLLVLLGRHPEELQAVQGLRGDPEGEGLMPSQMSRLASAGLTSCAGGQLQSSLPSFPLSILTPPPLKAPASAPPPIVLQVTKELLLLRWPHILGGTSTPLLSP